MNAQPQTGTGDTPSSDAAFVALTKSPGFWADMRYAALFGVVLAVAALAFLGLLKGGTKLWFTLPKTRAGWTEASGGWR
jgi:hypothetical protein